MNRLFNINKLFPPEGAIRHLLQELHFLFQTASNIAYMSAELCIEQTRGQDEPSTQQLLVTRYIGVTLGAVTLSPLVNTNHDTHPGCSRSQVFLESRGAATMLLLLTSGCGGWSGGTLGPRARTAQSLCDEMTTAWVSAPAP